jgi:hypothetical protein
LKSSTLNGRGNKADGGNDFFHLHCITYLNIKIFSSTTRTPNDNDKFVAYLLLDLSVSDFAALQKI